MSRNKLVISAGRTRTHLRSPLRLGRNLLRSREKVVYPVHLGDALPAARSPFRLLVFRCTRGLGWCASVLRLVVYSAGEKQEGGGPQSAEPLHPSLFDFGTPHGHCTATIADSAAPSGPGTLPGAPHRGPTGNALATVAQFRSWSSRDLRTWCCCTGVSYRTFFRSVSSFVPNFEDYNQQSSYQSSRCTPSNDQQRAQRLRIW